MDMSNLLSSLNSYCKIMMTKLFTKATQGNHAMHSLCVFIIVLLLIFYMLVLHFTHLT